MGTDISNHGAISCLQDTVAQSIECMFQACCACGGGSNAGFYRDNATLTALTEIFDSLGGPDWVHNDGVSDEPAPC